MGINLHRGVFMKKLICVICLIAFLLPCFQTAFAVTGQNMMVTITATCYDYNHVGDEWYEYYALNGYEMVSGDTVYFQYGDSFELYSQITENDVLIDDVGYYSEVYYINDYTLLNQGFTIDQYLTVQEDSGFYSGNWCEWYIHYEFIPV